MQEKKKTFSTIFKKWKKKKFSFGVDGDMDWVTICFSSLFILVLIFVWSIHLFLQVSKKSEAPISNETASFALIDQKGLHDVLDRYEKKKTDFNVLSEKNSEAKNPL